MKIKFLLLLALTYAPIASADSFQLPYTGVSIYAMPFSGILMNNTALDRFRRISDIKITSSSDMFATGFANEINLKSVGSSNTPVQSGFTVYVVLDFFSGDKRTTYVSDGLLLCTEDWLHCIKVGEDFRRRVDPSYDQASERVE